MTALEKVLRRWGVAGLVLLVAGVYLPVGQFDFVRWDDPVNVTHNPLVTEPWSWALAKKLVNGDTALRFKPLTWVIYRGLHAAWGFNPAAWHLLSLALHLGATVLFWLVLQDWLGRLRPHASAAQRQGAAFIGAALWAVHPMHVEPVSWVTATPYPLLTLWLLASFRFYSRAAWNPAPAARRREFFHAWIFAVLGYASYPVGVSYTLWLMVADIWLFRIAPSWKDGWTRLGPWLGRHTLFVLPAVASILVTWASSSTTPWLYPAPPTLAEIGPFVRMEMAGAMLAAVGTHFIWPFAPTPNNVLLPAQMIGGPMIALLAAGALLGLLAAWWSRKKRPAAAAVVFGAAGLALPVLGWAQWPTWSLADRHVYLPHLVFAGAMAMMLLPRAADARPAARWSLGGGFLAVILLALLARPQVMIWRNTDTLFTYIEQQPAFAWNPRQQAYIYQLWSAWARENDRDDLARRRWDQARRTLQEALIGAAQRGELNEAVELAGQLEQGFGLPPELRREKGRWLLLLGRRAEAARELRRALGDMPGDSGTISLLGQAGTVAGKDKAQ